MRPMVEFCINQLTPELEKIKEELETDPELDVLETSCLGNCEICAKTPYAMVDGEIITGDTAEELLKNIRKFIEKSRSELDELYDLF